MTNKSSDAVNILALRGYSDAIEHAKMRQRATMQLLFPIGRRFFAPARDGHASRRWVVTGHALDGVLLVLNRDSGKRSAFRIARILRMFDADVIVFDEGDR